MPKEKYTYCFCKYRSRQLSFCQPE